MTESNAGISKRAMELRQQALTDPEQVELGELAKIISNPAVPPAAHGAAVVALLNVARVRDDVGEAFVEDLGRLLGRPSLDTALVLRCLRRLALNDPGAALVLRDEIVDRISTESTDVTQAATGCCVELVATAPLRSWIWFPPSLHFWIRRTNGSGTTRSTFFPRSPTSTPRR